MKKMMILFAVITATTSISISAQVQASTVQPLTIEEFYKEYTEFRDATIASNKLLAKDVKSIKSEIKRRVPVVKFNEYVTSADATFKDINGNIEQMKTFKTTTGQTLTSLDGKISAEKNKTDSAFVKMDTDVNNAKQSGTVFWGLMEVRTATYVGIGLGVLAILGLIFWKKSGSGTFS